jgi:hypothetical protein
MSTVMWDQALQGVAPITGGQALPPATYRFRAVAGEGKESSNGLSMSLQFEVESGPLKGRKSFHWENMPNGTTDKDKQRMGYFLGLLEAYGITNQHLGQWFAGQPISVQTLDYIAKQLVASGRIVKATIRPRSNDASKVDMTGWSADDGIEPEPPKQTAAAPASPAGPGYPGQVPGGAPGAPGFPGGAPAGPQGFGQPGPGAGAPPNSMPLGGFPGSANGMQPNQAPQWADGPAGQQAQPQQFSGPGQAAPAAQPQAAGMNQFQQPAAAQFPQPNPQQVQTATQEGFPGQQFPGQVNPAAFPAQGQQQAAPTGYDQQMQAQGGFGQQQPDGSVQMPGIPQPQPNQFGQPQGAPGLPTGGFPQTGAPQANF